MTIELQIQTIVNIFVILIKVTSQVSAFHEFWCMFLLNRSKWYYIKWTAATNIILLLIQMLCSEHIILKITPAVTLVPKEVCIESVSYSQLLFNGQQETLHSADSYGSKRASLCSWADPYFIFTSHPVLRWIYLMAWRHF